MLFDGIKLVQGSEIQNLVVDSGTSFPANPDVGELFYRTDAPSEGLYVYSGTEWKRYVDWSEVTNKPSTYAPSAHTHAISDVTGLQAQLDSLASSKLDVAATSFGGNAATATTLQTSRTINGVPFDGSANITVTDDTKLPLAGGTLTGKLTAEAAGEAGFNIPHGTAPTRPQR